MFHIPVCSNEPLNSIRTRKSFNFFNYSIYKFLVSLIINDKIRRIKYPENYKVNFSALQSDHKLNVYRPKAQKGPKDTAESGRIPRQIFLHLASQNPFQRAINNRDYAYLITKNVPHFVLNEARKMKAMIFTGTRKKAKRRKKHPKFQMPNPEWLHREQEIKSYAYYEERARLFSISLKSPSITSFVFIHSLLHLRPRQPSIVSPLNHEWCFPALWKSREKKWLLKVKNYCVLITIIKREQ